MWFCLPLALLGCAGDAGLEIRGQYDDSYGGSFSINTTHWETGDMYDGKNYTVQIVQRYSNEEHYLLGEDATGFDRHDWTNHQGELYFCTSAFDQPSAEDAFANGQIDSSDPATMGCGSSNFSWSLLNPASLDIAGSYTSHEISGSRWTEIGGGELAIRSYFNAADFLIGKDERGYARIDWAEHQGQRYFCISSQQAETPESAFDEGRIDSSAPATMGCGSSSAPWSLLVPR